MATLRLSVVDSFDAGFWSVEGCDTATLKADYTHSNLLSMYNNPRTVAVSPGVYCWMKEREDVARDLEEVGSLLELAAAA